MDKWKHSPTESNWKDFVHYIQAKEPGTIITRQELLEEFYRPEYLKQLSGPQTIDTYRRLLIVVGVLDGTETKGQYKRGYVSINPSYYTKSKVEKLVKELYIERPYGWWACGPDIENYVYQEFKPESLYNEFCQGMVTKADRNCLGFRVFRVKAWNAAIKALKDLGWGVHQYDLVLA